MKRRWNLLGELVFQIIRFISQDSLEDIESLLIVKEMKRLYIIILLKELGIDKISRNAISIAIYGSHATGEYDEKATSTSL